MAIGFEGLVPTNDFATVPDDYAGLDWTNTGVLGKQFVREVDPHSGYRNVIDGKAVAYLYGDDGITGNAGFALAEGTFSLKSGIFASAWDTGDKVKFTALLDGNIVGHKHVTLDEAATLLTFGHAFKHIDAIEITWKPGTPVDTSEGFGPYLAADDLDITFDAPSAHAPVAHAEWIPDFAPHPSWEWPLV